MNSTQEKAIKLFTYLKELSKLRTTHSKDVAKYEEVLWFSDIPLEKHCHCIAWDLWSQKEDDTERRDDSWVEVHKPILKSPPEVPDDLEPWIKDDEVSNSTLIEPGLRDSITVFYDPDPETGEELTEVLSINDHANIFELWMKYSEEQWKPWAEEDRRLQRIQSVYNNLYTIYQRSEKLGEQYEVIVGLGFLLWRSPKSGEIRHPLLSLQARVSFDGVKGIMSVSPSIEGPLPRLEMNLLRHLQSRFGHVSTERLCSGKGITNIYAFLKESGYAVEPSWMAEQLSTAADPTPVIVNAALDNQYRCELCIATLNIFTSILGREAGNAALRLLATSGVYLGGGIPPRILAALMNGQFIEAFLNRGRPSNVLEHVPIYVILNRNAAILGAACCGFRMAKYER